MDNEKKPIRSFRDLEVYQRIYNASIISIMVIKEIVPKLPESEKYDLKDQISRASKAIPRLIAEGYAKRHQKFGFQKYLDDAMAECNETAVCLCHCRDIYSNHVNKELCDNLIETYDISGRQIYRLRESWTNFKTLNRNS